MQYPFREITINYNVNFLMSNSPFFCEFTLNSLSSSRLNYKFTLNPLSFSRNHYLLRDFTRNSSFFREFITYFANFLWTHNETTIQSIRIQFLLPDFSLNLLCFTRFPYLFREFDFNPLFFVILLLIHYLFRDFAMNSLSISRFHYEFTIHLANCPWIHFFSRFHFDFTISIPKSLSFSPNHYELTICFAISL